MFLPAESKTSMAFRIAAVSPLSIAHARFSSADRLTRPKTPSAASSVTLPSLNETSWSREESASRMPPSAPRAIARSASSSASMPSFSQTCLSLDTMSFVCMRLKSKRWQREMIVGRTLSPSVVANTNLTYSGGSSSVFKSAFHAWFESMWHSSIMNILYFDETGRNCTASIIGFTCSTLLWDAASSSVTSREVPAAISLQFTHLPHGSTLPAASPS